MLFIHLCSMEDFSTKTINVVPVVGLTGGLGSGKTTVGQVFESLSIPRWDADTAGHRVFRENAALRYQILNRFGKDLAVIASGECIDIRRSLLAERVFKNPDDLKQLNQWVHPLIRQSFNTWKNHLAPCPYVIREAAILFESGSNKDCDVVITVSAPAELRVRRAMQRSGMAREDAEQRMQRQWSDEERTSMADFEIINSLKSLLIPQVVAIHEEMLRKFQ